jgi:hypothetical protein
VGVGVGVFRAMDGFMIVIKIYGQCITSTTSLILLGCAVS